MMWRPVWWPIMRTSITTMIGQDLTAFHMSTVRASIISSTYSAMQFCRTCAGNGARLLSVFLSPNHSTTWFLSARGLMYADLQRDMIDMRSAACVLWQILTFQAASWRSTSVSMSSPYALPVAGSLNKYWSILAVSSHKSGFSRFQ